MGYEWCVSLGEILGPDWEPLVAISAETLPGYGARPRARPLGLSGDRPEREWVEWFGPDGNKLSNESGSPSTLHQRRVLQDATDVVGIARAVSEALALPGSRSAYHFGMMHAWNALFATRGDDRRVFAWIERLCLADIAMLEQGPELTFSGDVWSQGDTPILPVFPAFKRLSLIYLREGFLAAAAALERRHLALGGTQSQVGGLLERQTALLDEDGR